MLLQLELYVVFIQGPTPPVGILSMDVYTAYQLSYFTGTLLDPHVFEVPSSIIQLVELPRPHGYSTYGPVPHRRWPTNRSTHRHQQLRD